MYPIFWSIVVVFITGSLGVALGLNSLPAGIEEWIKNGFNALALAALPTVLLLILARSLFQTHLNDEKP